MLSWSSLQNIPSKPLAALTTLKGYTVVREEWILSSVLGKNIGKARDQTNNLLFLSSMRYELSYKQDQQNNLGKGEIISTSIFHFTSKCFQKPFSSGSLILSYMGKAVSFHNICSLVAFAEIEDQAHENCIVHYAGMANSSLGVAVFVFMFLI